MEIGDKYKHSSLDKYTFEVTVFCNNGNIKGIETAPRPKGRKLYSKTAYYPRNSFADVYESNNFRILWVKI